MNSYQRMKEHTDEKMVTCRMKRRHIETERRIDVNLEDNSVFKTTEFNN